MRYALLTLGFPACASQRDLHFAGWINSLGHSSIGTPSPDAACAVQAPALCRHTVSVTISLPSPGFFSPFPHGTCPLSVIRWYLALESGLPSFPPDFTCPMVLRNLSRKSIPFRLQDSHPLRFAFPNDSANPKLSHSSTGRQPDPRYPTTPHTQPLTGITRAEFRLNPLSLATTHGITIVFSSYRY